MSDVARPLASGAAHQIETYMRHRRAADKLGMSSEENLRLFDLHSARLFHDDDRLTQRMVDSWCERRPTESANSCIARCLPVTSMVAFLRGRGETDVVAPALPRPERRGYVPHAFTEGELASFFRECDSWRPAPNVRRSAGLRTMYTLPVIFRLLYSSGLRTCEARLLRRADVDLGGGVVRVVEGKGRSQRTVALHASMTGLMRRYDALVDGIWPGREYFFPGEGGVGCLARGWLTRWFSEMWSHVSDERATPYMLRHNYAVENINGLVAGGLSGLEDMEYLSKSMGHTSVEVTVAHYYHIVPALADALQSGPVAELDNLLPEVL